MNFNMPGLTVPPRGLCAGSAEQNSGLSERNNEAVAFARCQHDILLQHMKQIDEFKKVAAVLLACFLFTYFKPGLH